MSRRMAWILILSGLLSATASREVAAAAKSPATASRSCRRALGRTFGQLARLGFAEVDRCQRGKARGRTSRDCTTLLPGTPTSTTYRRWEHRTRAIVLARCELDNPARDPFPVKDFGNDLRVGDPTLVIPSVGARVEESVRVLEDGASASIAAAIAGDAAPGAECLAAVGEARSLVAGATMRGAVRCQRRLDATATTFGPLDPSCERPPPDATIREAAGRIAGACGGVTGPEIGTCAPLPGCVIDHATTIGLGLARTTYGQCGNGVVDGSEECDDGNADPADGCSRCTAPACGNGKVEGSEECDDGNPLDHDTCTQCQNPICGDGILDVGAEACDDGNATPFDGCTDCQSDPVTCSSAGVLAIVTIDYDPNAFVDISGMRVRVGYDPAALSIPGSLFGASISQRVSNLTGLTSGLSFSVVDRDLLPSEDQPDGKDDTLQTIVAISPGRVPPGPFEKIRFDCVGAEARASQLTCVPANVVDPFTNRVPDDETARQVQCSIQLETAPEQ